MNWEWTGEQVAVVFGWAILTGSVLAALAALQRQAARKTIPVPVTRDKSAPEGDSEQNGQS